MKDFIKILSEVESAVLASAACVGYLFHLNSDTKQKNGGDCDGNFYAPFKVETLKEALKKIEYLKFGSDPSYIGKYCKFKSQTFMGLVGSFSPHSKKYVKNKLGQNQNLKKIFWTKIYLAKIFLAKIFSAKIFSAKYFFLTILPICLPYKLPHLFSAPHQ